MLVNYVVRQVSIQTLKVLWFCNCTFGTFNIPLVWAIYMVCIIKDIFIQIGPVAPLEDEKTSPEMSNLIEQEVKRFTKVLFVYISVNLCYCFIMEIGISFVCIGWYKIHK